MLPNIQLSESVAAHLREEIMLGNIAPGSFIRLDEVATTLGVSATPVREALHVLRGEGLVRLEPRRGFVAAHVTAADLQDIFWLQQTIAARLIISSAPFIGESDIVALREINQRTAKAVAAQDVSTILASGFEFQRRISQMGPKRGAGWLLTLVSRHTPYRLYAQDPEWGTAFVDSCDRVIDHLSRHDLAAAAAEMSEHFEDGRRRLEDHLRAAGYWPE